MAEIKRDTSQRRQDTKAAISTVNRQLEERQTAKAAKERVLSYVDLAHVPINPDLFSLAPAEQLTLALAMPFFRVGKKLRLAVAEPDKQEAKALVAELQQKGYQISLALASLSGVIEAIQKQQSHVYEQGPGLAEEIEELEVGTQEEEIATLNKLKEKFASVGSAEVLNLLLAGAARVSASDIHLESTEHALRVRYRVDGILHDIFALPPAVASQLISQLKYQARMKLNITNVPQDGRFTFRLGERRIDLRVNSLPSTFGEGFVLRLLDHNRKTLSLSDLGFSERTLEFVNQALARPHGMILCTGPTGSGKTTSLYTMLSQVNQPDTKIITLEDPVEYHLEGIVQSQINESNGYDFAGGLRAILRQDPDVIMVGEIRDLETARTAAQAAMTGHLVFSTLHTNDALGTLPRLINMGLPSYMIAPSLSLVIAQRLVRRVCEKCKTNYELPVKVREAYRSALKSAEEVLGKKEQPDERQKPANDLKEGLPVKELREQPDDVKEGPAVVKGKGCEACSNTGYKGQVGLYEVFFVDQQMAELIQQEKGVRELHDYLLKTQNILSMREDGALKVRDGLTTMEEVLRVTADDTATAPAVAQQISQPDQPPSADKP